MNELKEKYKKDFELFRTLMDQFDPCGLIALGSPIDEYDYLTNKVLGLKHRGESRKKIKETILFELTSYFGEDLASFQEPYKTEFYNSLNKLLDETQRVT
jgi:hypothetical protein